MSDLDSKRIESVVREFLWDRFEISADRIVANTSVRDLGLDSMMMLEVLLVLEDRLGVKLTDLSMPANPMLSDVVAVVIRNQA